MSAEKRRPSIFWALASAVLPPASLLFRFDIRGELPQEGPFILAPNHQSEIDPLLMGIATWKLGRQPRFMAKESLFKGFVGRILEASGQIPVSRDPRKGNAQAMDAARMLVENGAGVIIYPEGTLTRDPDLWPMRGKNGAARIALARGIPVYPAAHWGVQDVFPRYAKKPRLGFRKRIVVNVGPPVDLSEFEGRGTSASALNAATEKIMREITALLEPIRGATAPAELWDPAKQGQTEHGRVIERDAGAAEAGA